VAPQSLQRALPTWLVFAWGIAFSFGALLLVAGLLGRGPLGRARARDLERAGSYLLASAASLYGLIVLMQSWPRGVVPGLLLLAIGLASAIYGWTRRPDIWTRLLLRQVEAEMARTHPEV
jgi:hypothetical protein